MRMRVYCKNCDTETNSGTILAINDEGDCETCRAAGTAELVPEYETPQQYEKRTGRKWNGAMFTKCFSDFCKSSDCVYASWSAFPQFETHDDCKGTLVEICAQSHEPPPDDWKPEERVEEKGGKYFCPKGNGYYEGLEDED